MATKFLTGKYLSGYTLTSAWTGVQVNASAVVAGTVGANGVYVAGAGGGLALDLPNAVTAVNHGYIAGGRGGDGGVNDYNGGAGGDGGRGVSLAAGGTLTNTDAIYGGAGGAGGYGGNVGGQGGGGADGVDMIGPGTLINSGIIGGGNGGAGAYGGHGDSTGGFGGTGVLLFAGGKIVNTGRISAGADGNPKVLDFATGIVVDGGGTVVNGSSTNHLAMIDGDTGVLVSNQAATIKNFGQIDGSGFASVAFSAGGLLIAEPGSYFGHLADGEGGATVELGGGTGTLANLGSTLDVSGSITGQFYRFASYVLDAGGYWTFTGANTIDGGRSLTSAAALTLAAGATVTLDDGTTFSVQGAITSGGTIALDSAVASTDLLVLAGGAVFGSGVVTMSGPKAHILGASTSAQLDNLGSIVGQGWIGQESLSLVNHIGALIGAIGKQGLVIDTQGGSMVNAGLIVAGSGSTLVLKDNFIEQFASFGNIGALSGGRVDLESDHVLSGTLSQSGTGVFNVNTNGSELDGAAQPLTLVGAIRVLGGVALTVDGAITNTGKLDAFGGSKVSKLIVGTDGVTLSGGGQVNMTASLNNIIVAAASGDTLTNVDNRIAGAGDIGDGSMVLVNQAKGQIVGNTGVTLTIDTGTHTITNAGTISSVASGQVVVKSALANTGLLFAAAGTLTLDGAVTGAGTAQIKKGVLNIAASFGETVTFVSGATGQLRLTDWKDFSGTVKGLSLTGTNTIDLRGFTKTGATASYSGATAAGVLTVTNGTQTARIHLTGNYTASTFTVANDGNGGVIVKDPPTASAAPLAQALAGFQHDPPPHLAASPAYRLPRFPMLHARA